MPRAAKPWAGPVLTRASQAQAAPAPTAHPHFPAHKQSLPTSLKVIFHHSYNLI